MANKSTKLLNDKRNAALQEAYGTFRNELGDDGILYGLRAIRKRILQDLTVTVAAYEMDCRVTDATHRVHKEQTAAFKDILLLKDRLDAANVLIKEYEAKMPVPEEITAEIEVPKEEEPTDG
jgi:hypothetical protein